ncbi:unnamed protein product [Ranitomeya imitator]|uniref:Ectonucleoside triphosphate diphosphohydrolase 6 n=1 Tax=Ranitomeya imitator TaxID=111125 RepID=A0ABN9KUX9_9NEOB|nr:unnamed protein product [Ranitomeya imitator]
MLAVLRLIRKESPASLAISRSETTTMKIPKLPFLLFVALCITLYVSYLRWTPNTQTERSLPNLKSAYGSGRESAANEIFYGLMFDAGSTGTRVHVYKFSQTSSGAPHLEHELFKAIKPGLSEYADEPEKCAAGIKELLDIAIEEIPEHLRRSTPLVLKATAGLRLLPEEKALKLLDTVKNIFQSSPFLVGKERIFAWITVNFLTGSLTNPSAKLAGMLDLGGGSTQITFYPYEKGKHRVTKRRAALSNQMFTLDTSDMQTRLWENGRRDLLCARAASRGHFPEAPCSRALHLRTRGPRKMAAPTDERDDSADRALCLHATFTGAPAGYITNFVLFNRTFHLYSHSQGHAPLPIGGACHCAPAIGFSSGITEDINIATMNGNRISDHN